MNNSQMELSKDEVITINKVLPLKNDDFLLCFKVPVQQLGREEDSVLL